MASNLGALSYFNERSVPTFFDIVTADDFDITRHIGSNVSLVYSIKFELAEKPLAK
jgi:hypothetical protein